MDIIEKLSLAGLIPVIKVDDAADAVPLCRALVEGGLPVAEITFRTPAAEQAIRNVHTELPEMLLGAGTVLTIAQVKRAVSAGAKYIVSPGLNPTVARYCAESGTPIIPGCANPSDIERALELGIKTVKFFPAEALGGVKMIKALSAPYGDVGFVPTGGINEKNAAEYFACDKIKAIGGSWMVPSDAVKARDWRRVTELTRQAVDIMLGFKLRHVGINSDDAENDARAIARLLGWNFDDRGGAIFVRDEFEVMKAKGRGARGHIAISTGNVERAMYHMRARGFEFEDEPVTVKDGKIIAIYLKNEIAGFAFHLIKG